MSDKLPQGSQNEEVDLGQLFNAIGKLFEKLIAFIGKIFKGLFSTVIYALKPIVNHFKVIAIVVMVAAILGFVTEKYSKPIYTSSMVVKPYFDSKYQLANNVDYFNSLIGSRNLKELAAVFEIDTLRVTELVGFEIEIGPETVNDIFKNYNDYLQTIDSTVAKGITYEDYVDNRDILSGDIYTVKAKSTTNTIFNSLDTGFEKTFKNSYSKKTKDIRDRAIAVKTRIFKSELKRIDSLQKIYIQVLKTDSENGNASIGLEGLIPLTKEKSVTREYDLFKEQMAISDSLKILEQELIIKNDYYDVLSGFEDVGTIQKTIWDRYSLIFPLVTFLLIIIVYLAYNSFKFIRDYE
ncbi:MAG: hypothetical protein ABF246_11120 [Winogradskyella sp.]